ncbi:MAG: hypothetical protein HOK28_03145 [Deltaproteobacteria bacterium]|jgi:hypothetical protein|nr:hypothetical protein [Deltaproteobacteria bacterium]
MRDTCILILAMSFVSVSCVKEDSATAATTDSEIPQPTNSISSVMLAPVACDSGDSGLPEGWAAHLIEAGLTKCASPFGVIIGASSEVPDTYVAMVAKIVAELLDPDMDGIANDPAVLELMQNGKNVWLPMPTDESSWSSGVEDNLGEALQSYGIMIPRWWLGSFSESGPDDHAKAVMVEEVVHAFTQFGYGVAYPNIFGVNNWNSVIAKETQTAQCDWWQHPENSCPGRPSEGGDCSNPSCDITEFYQQVVVLRAGMTPGWFGIGFPQNRTLLETKLSSEIKTAIDNPDYNQLRAPLTFSYATQ